MKILLLDIETSPNIAYVWGLYDQNIGIHQMIDSSKVLCYAAKWLGDKEVVFDSIHKTNRKKMLKGIHGLINEADGIVTYNGNKFDLPILNKEFLLCGLNPPQPAKKIDLLRTVRSNFKFTSNKLDYVSQQLGLGKKEEHEGFDLWVKCMDKDNAAWGRMEKYNIQDVVLLEKLYYRLLPWIKNLPNHNLEADAPVCPSCGSKHLHRSGTRKTVTALYQRYKCSDCGSWSQSSKALSSSVEVKGITG
jgi:DNA polymerase elongation subunit (family B)/DNA-directed RNA polymerase subunit RPC12/RpoP